MEFTTEQLMYASRHIFDVFLRSAITDSEKFRDLWAEYKALEARVLKGQ